MLMDAIDRYENLISKVLGVIHSNKHSMDTQVLMVMKTTVRQAMKDYLFENRNPFEVDYQGKIDAVDLIFNVLKEHEKNLDTLINNLDNTTSGIDKLTINQAVRDRVRVGAVHRVTIKEFETGTWLIKDVYLRKDGSVGAVSLSVQ